jgi:hypothetical protein
MKIFGPDENAMRGASSSGGVTVVAYGVGKINLPVTAAFAERGAGIFSGQAWASSGDSLYQPEK